jgi:hypothetical protein
MRTRLSVRRARLTIGLGIGRESMRAVALRGDRIVWALERARGEESLAHAIGQLLADAPLTRWPRPRIIAAVGPSHAQTKRLVGLPVVSDVSQLDTVVRESASRFFLRNGVPLVTTCRAGVDGAPWGAAIERPVLEAIERACRGHRVTLSAVVPTVAVLALAVERESDSAQVIWRDGDLRSEVTAEGRTLIAVRRASTESCGDMDVTTASSALRALDPDGWRFADALGAARARPWAVLAWHPSRGGRDSRSVPGWRLALAGFALLVSATAALAGPGVAARFTERRAAARLTSLAPVRRKLAFAEREVWKVTAALAEVSAFDASRYSMTRLLGDLTRALPEESALVTLRVTRDAGSLVALTPRAAAVLVKLESVPGIEGAEIVGPVTREVVAGKALERVTVRFRVSSQARRANPGTPDGAA